MRAEARDRAEVRQGECITFNAQFGGAEVCIHKVTHNTQISSPEESMLNNLEFIPLNDSHINLKQFHLLLQFMLIIMLYLKNKDREEVVLVSLQESLDSEEDINWLWDREEQSIS